MTANADLHLKPRQLYAIGLYASQWAYFEAEMNSTIAALGELVEKKQTMPTRFKERAGRWRILVLAQYKEHPKMLKEAGAIIDDAIELHKSRSIILHGRVYGHPEPRSRYLYIEGHRHLNEWRVEFRVTTAALIIEGAELVKRLAERLIEFNEKHLPVSPIPLPRRYL